MRLAPDGAYCLSNESTIDTKARTNTHTYKSAHTHSHIHIHTQTHKKTHTQTQKNTHTYTKKHNDKHTLTPTNIHANTIQDTALVLPESECVYMTQNTTTTNQTPNIRTHISTIHHRGLSVSHAEQICGV